MTLVTGDILSPHLAWSVLGLWSPWHGHPGGPCHSVVPITLPASITLLLPVTLMSLSPWCPCHPAGPCHSAGLHHLGGPCHSAGPCHPVTLLVPSWWVSLGVALLKVPFWLPPTPHFPGNIPGVTPRESLAAPALVLVLLALCPGAILAHTALADPAFPPMLLIPSFLRNQTKSVGFFNPLSSPPPGDALGGRFISPLPFPRGDGGGEWVTFGDSGVTCPCLAQPGVSTAGGSWLEPCHLHTIVFFALRRLKYKFFGFQ